jgi:hypothetical protein
MTRKNKAYPGKEQDYISEAQRRHMDRIAARQRAADEAAAGTSDAAAAAAPTTGEDNAISRTVSLEELQRVLRVEMAKLTATLTAQLEIRDAKIERLEAEIRQLKAAPAAASSARASGDVFVKPAQLQALVPEELVQQVHRTISTTMEQERRGMTVFFDTVPRPPKPHQGAQGGAGTSDGNRQRSALRLVDLHMAPGSRRALASLGRVLRERHGILIRDALTRAGVEARQRRGAVFAALRNEAQKPGAKVRHVRWEEGIDITYLNERNGRVKMDFTKPLQGQLPEELVAQLSSVFAAASMTQGANVA